MKIKKKHKITAIGLALFLVLCCPVAALAFDPWSNVSGYWISADGKTPIKGALKKGITITKYQNRAGEINWKEVSRGDISFAMVRLGYYNDPDPYFKVNMTGAASVGMDTGVCFYGNATTVEGARREARYVLDMVKEYRVSYPIAYDVESQELLEEGFTRSQITDQVEAFCKVIEDAGYRAVIFGTNEWLTLHMDTKRLPYDIWYSRYGLANNFENRTLWRCTDMGTVRGIEGSVCLEFVFEDYGKTYKGTGWRMINGKRYYFEDHRLIKNITMEIDGSVYSFDKDGNARMSK